MNAAMGIDQASGLASLRDDMSMGGRQFKPSDFKGIGSVTFDDLASKGRFGDKYLTHVSEGEILIPKEFLEQNPNFRDQVYKEMGSMGFNPSDFTVNAGDLTNRNPKTGLMEFGFLSKVWKSVKKVVEPVANIVLPIAATAACGGNPACGAAASAALTKAQGGSWGDALKSAAFTYAGQSFAMGAGSNMGQAATGGAGIGGWEGINAALNPYNAATQSFQMPGFISGSGIQSFGQTATANPVQNFFQGLGGAAKAAFTPGVSMGQGYSGYTTDPLTGGITSIGGTSTVSPTMGTYNMPAPNAAAQQMFGGLSPEAQTAFNNTYNSTFAATGSQAEASIAAMKAANQTTNALSSATTYQKLTGNIPGLPSSAGAGAGAGESGILGTLGKTAAVASFAAPALASYFTAQEPIPENEMVQYDETARKEIEAYNACVSNPQTKGTCAVPTDLKPVALDINTGQAPGSLYTALQQGQTPTQGIGAMAGGAPIGGGTNVIDIYRQIAQNRQPAPIQYGVQALYKAAGGSINGPGTGTSDSIPAMLSDGEFVMTAQAVRGAGNGSRQAGVKKMYNMMRKFEGAA